MSALLKICTWIFLLTLPIIYSSKCLHQGQVIKQFFAYSITEHLSRAPFDILSTTLPCQPIRSWVEEPPIFHFIAGLTSSYINENPAIIPLTSYLAILWVVHSFLVGLKVRQRVFWLALGSIGSAPIFLRYSVEHLPDLMATAFLCIGSLFIWKQKNRLAYSLFALAVTTKALTIFAILPILIWSFFIQDTKINLKSFFRFGAVILTITAPFAAWIIFITMNDIPNPFRLGSIVENRHSGSLNLLLDSGYWSRFITWNATKGVGIILFAAALFRITKFFINKKSSTDTDFNSIEGLMTVWSIGVFPYWILVRQGNYTHDYYTLPFALPLAILGTQQLLSVNLKFKLNKILLGLAIITSIISFTKSGTSRGTNQDRPMFCEWERG
jgi:4-amino-4-deoxy-L-arabinose transferase-like glycosyltransferase